VITLTRTLFLWQRTAITAVLIAVSVVVVAYRSAPSAKKRPNCGGLQF